MADIKKNLIAFAFLGWVVATSPLLAAEDANQLANRTFIEAIGLIRKAGNTYDTQESVRLLRGADRLLKKITSDYPESTLAVQISTNQFVGDFDPVEFKSRIRSLSCERGSYVEEFLSEYGIPSSTGPLTEACFLYRMETLLSPTENPISAARWDWLSLAAAYHLHGQVDRAREIILPFLSALYKKSSTNDNQDSLLFLSRVMMVTGEDEQAMKIAQRISDCSARLYSLVDMMRLALWSGHGEQARELQSQLQSYTRDNQCNWQMALVAESLHQTGHDEEAKKLYHNLLSDQFTSLKENDRAENTPPELAIAASMVGEPATALAILKTVREQNPWTVPAVMNELAARSEFDSAADFADGLKDIDLKAEAYAALVVAASQRDDKKNAEPVMARLAAMRGTSSEALKAAIMLAMRARAEKAFYKDERWRETFQAALNTADLVDDAGKRQVALPLISTLAYIKTGNPVLD